MVPARRVPHLGGLNRPGAVKDLATLLRYALQQSSHIMPGEFWGNLVAELFQNAFL